MLSFNRRAILLLPIALGACGFTPVYGPGGAGAALRGKVHIAAPDNVDSFHLVQNLEDQLGRADVASYALSFTLRTDEQRQAINAANEITRYSLIGKVDYVLVATATSQVIASGSVDNFTGYSATGSTVETLAAERDARVRLMAILAEQITTRLYATADVTG